LREVLFAEAETDAPSSEDSSSGGAAATGAPAEVSPATEPIDQTAYTQASLFALEVALFRLVESWGVRPDFLMGHSIGELSAAHAAGVLSLEDACELVAARGRLMGALPKGGAMVSIQASEEDVLRSLEGSSDRIALAAINGPSSVVISGEEDAVLEMEGSWRERGAKTKRLRVSHAFHSHRMDGMLAEFREVAQGISFYPPQIPIVSNVTGEPISPERICTAEYWVKHVREPVRFLDGVRWLRAHGVTNLLELGPDGVLSAITRDCLTGEPAAREDELTGDATGQEGVVGDPGDTGIGVDGDTVAEPPVVAVPLLRGDRPEVETLLGALAEIWVRGAGVDWAGMCKSSGARRVPLPTYAFQRERYWLSVASAGAGDVSSAGLGPADHPLLGAAVALADERGCLFTGRFSQREPTWLADHVVLDACVVPGVVFVELAMHAGSQLECGLLEELVMESPLVLEEHGDVQLQVAVYEPDGAGRRQLRIYSRAGSVAVDDRSRFTGGQWTRHASGVLAPGEAAVEDRVAVLEEGQRAAPLATQAWPPEDAQAVELDAFYGHIAKTGLDYGPAFLGVRAVWRRGEELYAELSLTDGEQAQAGAYRLHPALFDAAVQVIIVGLTTSGVDLKDDGNELRLPFSFTGTRVYATGAGALRVRLSPSSTGGMSMVAVDEDGALVASMQALTVRPVSREQLARARSAPSESLFGVNWSTVSVTPAASRTSEDAWALLGAARSGLAEALQRARARPDAYEDLDALSEAVDGGAATPSVVLVDCAHDGIESSSDAAAAFETPAEGVVEATRGIVHRVLALVQAWVANERFSAARLVLMTRGAVVTDAGEDLAGLAQSPVWGLVRCAQAEHPNRLVLIDADNEDASGAALSVALASDEPQLALRAGRIFAPRLVRAITETSGESTDEGPVVALDAQGTVLITGGTGALGGLLARHLVTDRGVGHVVLASRRGHEAPGAAELEAELIGLGAQVRIARCDVADRTQLKELLDAVPEEHPLSGVVHTAGVLDDAVIDSLTVERVDRVLAPKLDAAWHLHELTRHLDLSMFALFSSVTATLGSPGQGNYAAANAFLDALASHRRARGLAGTSMAWGLWAQASGMGGELGETDLARMARSGIGALSAEEGLELFDAASVIDEALVLPLRLDTAALRAQAEGGTMPALFSGLVRTPSRRVSKGAGGSLARRLAATPEAERKNVALQIVLTEIATALGHDDASPHAIGKQRAFNELGLDSLSALELRNRLNEVTGMRLPATLIFDYPTPIALADYLVSEVSDARIDAAAPTISVAPVEEPIAIVGMSCRFPGGVRSPQDLWELVAGGVDAISEFPADRGWDLEGMYDHGEGRPGTCYAREGGFIYDVGSFDAAFFEISPREALAMDPAQRVLLEVSWEALEDAGIDPVALRGSRTGVFAGHTAGDFGAGLWSAPKGLESLAGYWLTGSIGSVVSGRVSYALGLEGPAVSVDTACSSASVALHTACGALRAGECSLALAGGVTILDTPGLFVQFSGQRGLARDGRCKSFADAADGVGWGEGAGMVLLERQSDAERNGRQVLALIRGSAVNQDGASNGLSAPNGPSQQRVIAQALANAGLSADQVDAVEAHGTGTTLGDPIEAQALLSTYGRDRSPERPLWLGSLKSNIGHTGAAAGVAGVIKMVMALRRGVLPKTLHVDRPSAKVDWSAGAVSLLTEERSWQSVGRSRRAGVSSFGVSGTNAHIILEEAPPARVAQAGALGDDVIAEQRASEALPESEVPADRVLPFLLSGRTEQALRAQAERLRECVNDDPHLRIADIGYSLTDRPAFEHRGVVVCADREELLEGLGALAHGQHAPAVIGGVTPAVGDGLACLFTGQGSQRVGMGRELYESYAVFRETLDGVCVEFSGHLERPLLDVIFGNGSEGSAETPTGTGHLDRTVFTQAGLFALEVALFRLIETWGVRPDYLLGHSIGELAAAYAAEAFSLEDACALVAARGRLMGALPEGGAMVAIQASEQEAVEILQGCEGRVALAAVNGPSSVVISGDEDRTLDLAAAWGERGRKTRRLQVSHAFHSPHMDAMLEEFAEVAGTVTFAAPRIPIVSNVSGEVLSERELCGGDYWARHVRETVRFCDGVRWLRAQGVGSFLELGPDGVLSAMVHECLGSGGEARPPGRAEESGIAGGGAAEDQSGDPFAAVSLLRGERPEARALTSALSELWAGGVEADWGALFSGTGAERVKLPTYAFQRERYWLSAMPGAGDAASIGQAPADHPLLGSMVELADGRGWLFTSRLSLESHAWLGDHAVSGSVLLPGAGFLDLALSAGARVGCATVQELTLEAPLVFSERGAVQLQLAVGEPDESGRRPIDVYSRPQQSASEGAFSIGEWTRHASGVLAPANAVLNGRTTAVGERAATPADDSWPPRDARPVDLAGVYDVLAERGFEYGPEFQGLRAAWRRGEDLFAEVALAQGQREQAAAFSVHPALLDAAFHAGLSAMSESADGEQDSERGAVRLPFSFGGVGLHATGASSLRVRQSPVGDDAVSLVLTDEAGGLVASVDALMTREIAADQLGTARGAHRDSLFRMSWSECSVSTQAPASELTLLGGTEDSALAESLRGVGVAVEVYRELEELSQALEEEGAAAPELVLFDCGLDRVEDEQRDADELAAAHRGVQRVLELLQSWLADERFSGARLALLTNGAVGVEAGDGVRGLALSPVLGLVRSAQSENPERFVLIDSDEQDASLAALAAALAAGEPQLAIREGAILAPRLARAEPDRALTAPADVSEWRLDAGGSGTLEDLSLVPAPEAAEPLERGQIRVGMRAAGLNFRDVLIALGVYPGEAAIGGEGAGVVLELGAGVEDLAVGDRVMGLLAGGFGRVSVSDRRLVARVPAGWSFGQAASVPTAFLTAYHAFMDLADLKPDEKVLVHAGAGGVGMAAVQLARHLGAEVFATASPAKWQTLRSLGLDETHIASSRTLEFRERFRDGTGGYGVDVVLDSLAGEFVDASLDLLAEGGRFIEMGKADIRDADVLARERPGVSYRAFDLTAVDPERIERMLGELLELFRAGALEPLPLTAWDIHQAPEAFRFMSQARHTGKNVLTIPAPIDPQGTVLITGGTGMLGALLARHLVSARGAGRLLLVSRRGEEAPGADALQTELEALGASVRIAACDVSSREDLKGLLDSISVECPLSAVVHAAGVLDDCVIGSLTAERVEPVFGAKADAAWYLHELTKDLDLQAFVLFSSAAATLGSPGQGNYAAANAFLDSLAAYRRARGLPGVSLAWGMWEQSGGLTEGLGKADIARMERSGLRALSRAEGLELFDAALGGGEALMLPLPLDRRGLRAQARMGVLPALFSDLVESATRSSGEESGLLALRLADVPESEREGVLLEFVRTHVATVLGHDSAEGIDTQQTFKELGFDSLTAVELRNRLNTATGLHSPATLVFDYPTTSAVAAYLLREMAPGVYVNDDVDSGEGDIRHALASIPLARLREAGLLQILMQMASPGDELSTENGDVHLIDTMDVEGLVQRAVEGSAVEAMEGMRNVDFH
jgi:acyl transferase domain-containing protein/NADPH:quinone reductase-like Zn-dependent oxidoreductase/acyl carrier protein